MRRGKSINVLKETLVGIAVIVVGVPPILALFVFMIGTFATIGGTEPMEFSTQVLIWALLTGAVVLPGAGWIATSVRGMADHLDRSEVADFTLFQHAMSSQFENFVREQVGDLELVSFDYTYALAKESLGGIAVMDAGEDTLVGYAHGMYFSVLGSQVPPFRLLSKTQTWDVSWLNRIVGGDDLPIDPEFDAEYRLQSIDEGRARDLFGGPVRDFVMAHPGWTLEVIGDRLLAYKVAGRGLSLSRTSAVSDPAKAVFWELVLLLQAQNG